MISTYTTGTLGSVEDTVTYSYGNSDWKDLLISYDGITISYDASGNPLNWTDERTITWVGCQLDSITCPDGARWAFKYDHNGLRTERVYQNYPCTNGSCNKRGLQGYA